MFLNTELHPLKINLGKPSLKKKSKYQDIVLISAYSYPPTTNKDTLIRDNFDFIFPPTLLKEIGTFLGKSWFPSTFLMIFTF